MLYTYKAKLVRCVDGDTIDVEIDLGFYMTAKIRGRLLGVDTPERGRENFHEATEMLHDLINKECDEEGYFWCELGRQASMEDGLFI